ncbi:hypothetical protein PM082_002246 [Marasmius tenuissimus]|nr:hypothetical protein PM082_002246 [Marasmius tenuissimus]
MDSAICTPMHIRTPSQRTLTLTLLLSIPCVSAFNLTHLSDSPIYKDEITTLSYTWDNNLDTQQSKSMNWEWILFHVETLRSFPTVLKDTNPCPLKQVEKKVFNKAQHDWDVQPNPTPSSPGQQEISGNFNITPKMNGDSVLCVYGNVLDQADSPGYHDYNNISLIFNHKISVIDRPQDSTPSRGFQIATIVGSVVGTLSIIIIAAVAAWCYRRYRHRKKLAEFHNDRMVFVPRKVG